MSFDAVPVLDLSRADDASAKPAFLDDLRQALLQVGFLYIRNGGIDPALTEDVVTNCRAFFDLPDEAKLAVEMKNAGSFLGSPPTCTLTPWPPPLRPRPGLIAAAPGYSRLGNETTAHRTDFREQLDLSTPHAVPGPAAPLYHHLRAPNQWPAAALLPAFRPTFERYIAAMAALSMRFTALVAEALGLAPTAFDRFFDADQQHKLKIVKYPDVGDLPAAAADAVQGVGPHKDSMLTSYLLQASPHPGLQARNRAGRWVDVPPLAGTLVVAVGQGLEALTRGACAATAHRVRAPPAGAGPRFSVPFFQGVSYDATFESVDVPDAVLAEKRAWRERAAREARAQGRAVEADEVEFTFVRGRFAHLGEATLWNRCKSHPDVAARWFPRIWAEILEERRREGRTAEALMGEEPAEGGQRMGVAGLDREGAKAVEAH